MQYKLTLLTACALSSIATLAQQGEYWDNMMIRSWWLTVTCPAVRRVQPRTLCIFSFNSLYLSQDQSQHLWQRQMALRRGIVPYSRFPVRYTYHYTTEECLGQSNIIDTTQIHVKVEKFERLGRTNGTLCDFVNENTIQD